MEIQAINVRNQFTGQVKCQRRFNSDPLPCLIAEVNLTHPGSLRLRCSGA
jgi:hypothetical protein